jgi:PAS domain S-box-containing protein
MDEINPFVETSQFGKTAGLPHGDGKREDEQFGRALFEQTGECIFIIDLDLRYVTANEKALSLLGYSREELAGMKAGSVISLGESPGQEYASVEQAGIYDGILRKKDGTAIPVEINTSVVSNDDGAPSYILSIVRDISDRKSAEKILKRNGRILSVISEATARLFRSPRIDEGISQVLEALGNVLELFGCAIFEIDGYSGSPRVNIRYCWLQYNVVGFNTAAAISPFIENLMESPQAAISEVMAGESRGIPNYSFLAIPLRGLLGPRGYLGMFDRVNNLSWLLPDFDAIQTAANLIGAAMQRIQFEETIQANDFRNRMIVSYLPDLLIRIDSNGTILDYNSNPNHPLFIHRDLIAGRKLVETWPAEIVEQILGDGNRKSFTVPYWLEGFQLPFSSSMYESRLHPISPDEALIIVRDISDKLRLNEMKTDFINRASHELRTPLTAAILMAGLIQEGGTPQEMSEYWGILNNELARQKKLIDSLLMAGRLESGMMKLEHIPLDLLPILKDALQAVNPIAKQKEVSLVFEAPRESLNILGDEGGLQQVFINLINNAVKFSPSGSSVKITVGSSGGYVNTAIIDQGMGISPAALPHLFEKFYRAKNVTVAEIPGTGIGLYIVKSVVEELGGRIEVKSELNAGTTFTVRLKPAAQAAPK